ncbi:hypothetical protein QFZ77_007375 [Paenibacillus sp. V4I3]|uniref:hypothetical protein n=1 Tax=unclassified Paenibacillus TaxID=185978 RepID=UPI0027812029|nr:MULTISPECIES: hypothetical protein [unclassified Paenibacillus]MDQ0878716.1 hypothetical protein [Paenibacillus sp. V4I3]MDQ0885428.1 hypothetical protein [Paenibacillus sp. V4I9]
MITVNIKDCSSWDQAWQQSQKNHGNQTISMWDARAQTFAGNALGNAAEGFALTPEEGSNFYRIQAEFLIDDNGIVQDAHYGQLVIDHLSLDVIDRFAAGNNGAVDLGVSVESKVKPG